MKIPLFFFTETILHIEQIEVHLSSAEWSEV